MAKKSNYAEALAHYETLVKTNPKLERKGATMPYTSHNGNMFSLLTKDGYLILRMDEKEREAFNKKYQMKTPVQYGAVMKEYVQVPDELLKKAKELKKYFDKSWEYVQTLKAKKKK